MKPKLSLIILAILSLVLLSVYFIPMPVYYKHVMILTLFYAYMGTAWNIMCGYAGRLSLGHAAFAAIGAYTTLILYKGLGTSPWLGMIVGGVLAVCIMMLIAYPCFRFGLKGPYFTLASIALMEIVQNLLTYMRDLTGGSLGMSLPYKPTNFALFQFDGKESYYLIILFFWAATVFAVWKMERTRYYLEAIREDESAASALGISVNKNLIKGAAISAFLVAIGGTFYVQYFRYIDPYTIAGFGLSLNLALVTIIGGSGTIFGPTIGAVILIPLSEFLRLAAGTQLPGLHLFVYGVLLIITIIYLPKGIASIPGLIKSRKVHKASLAKAQDAIAGRSGVNE
ncbi:MAG: branched-chain amino acid ABC transporter permease [Syntrophomonadaceae bacterium]|nr:branched-chain amino acid ABC transporter permease [Syntrophomonadaceae bacterium]